MMKKLLLAGAAFAALSTAAGAADLPARTSPVAPVFTAPAFTWTGFYVGVNAGYGFTDEDDDNGTTFVPGVGDVPTLSGGNNDGGFVGGGQIGYNFQFGQFVWGVEADIQYADLDGDDVTLGAVGAPGVVVRGSSGLEWFGTVRGRLGFAFDRALIYATGGFAYGGGGGGSDFGFAGFDDDDDVNGGWTIGGGVEYAFTNNLTFKVEGLYINIDRGNGGLVYVPPVGTPVALAGGDDDDGDFGVVRAGLNFKF